MKNGNTTSLTEASARFGLALTAIMPWLYNWYIADAGLGPEMTAEIASSMAVIVTSILNRIAE